MAGTPVQNVAVVDSSGNVVPGAGSAVIRTTYTDRSGTITTGGTSQQLAAANATRNYLLVQNQATTGNIWVNFTAAATTAQPSIKIPAGASYSWPDGNVISTEVVNVTGDNTGMAFCAKEG